jgi:hypothetical protein
VLQLWLSGVQAGRITDVELREKLIRYQKEAAVVLWQAFRPQILIDAPPEDRERALAINQLEQIIEQSKAMQRMAEEQIALIRRMDAVARIVKTLQTDVADVKVRLGVPEEVVRSLDCSLIEGRWRSHGVGRCDRCPSPRLHQTCSRPLRILLS